MLVVASHSICVWYSYCPRTIIVFSHVRVPTGDCVPANVAYSCFCLHKLWSLRLLHHLWLLAFLIARHYKCVQEEDCDKNCEHEFNRFPRQKKIVTHHYTSCVGFGKSELKQAYLFEIYIPNP